MDDWEIWHNKGLCYMFLKKYPHPAPAPQAGSRSRPAPAAARGLFVC